MEIKSTIKRIEDIIHVDPGRLAAPNRVLQLPLLTHSLVLFQETGA
jgi:hypothetical protein